MRMETRIHYIYVYRTVFRPAAGGVAGGSDAQNRRAANLAALAEMGGAGLDPDKAAKLEKLTGLVRAMMNKLQNIPARRLQESLGARLDAIMLMAQSGAVDAALEQAEALMGTVEEAVKAGARIGRAKGQLTGLMASLPPEARSAVKGVIQAADMMLDAANSVDAMNSVASMLEGAIEIASRLKSLTPGSQGFEAAIRELEHMAGIMEAHADIGGAGDLDDPTKGRPVLDGLKLAVKEATDTLKQLRQAQPDSLKQARIQSIEDLMRDVHHSARQLPTEGMKQIIEQVTKQILHDTATGKIDEAHQGAQELHAFVDRMGKMDRHLGIKQARAERIAQQLQGPAKETMASVMKRAQAIREQATSPEEMHALDAALLEAAQLAEKIQQNPKSREALKAHRELKALEKKLEGLTKEKDPGDRLTSSQELARSLRPHMGTQPLHEPTARGKGGDVWSTSAAYRHTRELLEMPAMPRLTDKEFERIASLIQTHTVARAADGPARPANAPPGKQAPQR